MLIVHMDAAFILSFSQFMLYSTKKEMIRDLRPHGNSEQPLFIDNAVGCKQADFA